MTPVLRRRQQRRYPGLYRGLVVDTADPQQNRRVQVIFPWLPRAPAAWADTLRDPGGPPEVGDEVLVGFDAGRLAHPYVVGVLAAGRAPLVELSDEHGNSLRLSPSGIDIAAAGEVRINASKISFASALGSADAGMWTFSGVVKSSTLIADSVVAASYTPGAGNLQ
jgi:hypothetical protein